MQNPWMQKSGILVLRIKTSLMPKIISLKRWYIDNHSLYFDVCTWNSCKTSTNDLSGSYWEMQDHLHNDYCPKEIGQLLNLFGWAVRLPSPSLVLFSDYTATRCYEKCVFHPCSLLLDVYFVYRVLFDRVKRWFIYFFNPGYQGPRSKYFAFKLSGVSSGKDS